ncbi:hypothetical protein K523DRAFT_293972 [Schizophyllum commune Tattone D]|nr:hypothetical protein K523DRAFT_293972 [Schizophyllum commune Tattone D]
MSAISERASPALPIELLEVVMDELGAREDQESLRCCALAHSVLRKRCQQLLFSSIFLMVPPFSLTRKTPCQRLLDILRRSGHLADYINSIRVEKSPPTLFPSEDPQAVPYGVAGETALLQLLPMLGKVRIVEFRSDSSFSTNPDNPDNINSLASLCLSSVEALILWDINLSLFVLDSFPGLRSLACTHVRWVPRAQSDHSATIPLASPRILELEVQGPSASYFIDFLDLLRTFDPPAFSNLTTLRICRLGCTFSHIISMIHRCKHSLERLEIANPMKRDTGMLDLSQIPRLQHLSIISVWIENMADASSRFLRMLRTIRSLSRLSIAFLHNWDDVFTHNSHEWANLDEVLGCADRHIGHVSLYVNYPQAPCAVVDRTLVKSLLPRLHERLGDKLVVLSGMWEHSYLS